MREINAFKNLYKMVSYVIEDLKITFEESSKKSRLKDQTKNINKDCESVEDEECKDEDGQE